MLGPTAQKTYNSNNVKVFQTNKVQKIYYELQQRDQFRQIINAFSLSRFGGHINSISPTYTNIYVQNWNEDDYGDIKNNQTVTDAQIRAAITKMKNNNQLIYSSNQSESVASDRSFTYEVSKTPSIFSKGDIQVVAIHLEPGFYVSGPSGIGTTCVDICAYHSKMTMSDGKKLFYSVIPYANNENCNECRIQSENKGIKAMVSHEMSEILTKAALGDNYVAGAGAEIADVCSWVTFNTGAYNSAGTVTLQQIWDVSRNNCSSYN